MAEQEADLTRGGLAARRPSEPVVRGDGSARIEAEIRATMAELDATVSALQTRMRGTSAERTAVSVLAAAKRGWRRVSRAVRRHPLPTLAACLAVGAIVGSVAARRLMAGLRPHP